MGNQQRRDATAATSSTRPQSVTHFQLVHGDQHRAEAGGRPQARLQTSAKTATLIASMYLVSFHPEYPDRPDSLAMHSTSPRSKHAPANSCPGTASRLSSLRIQHRCILESSLAVSLASSVNYGHSPQSGGRPKTLNRREPKGYKLCTKHERHTGSRNPRIF